MTLANDILKHNGNLIPSRQINKREPFSYLRKTKAPVARKKDTPKTDIPGVSWSPGHNQWCAYFYDGNTTVKLGLFRTAERAGMAVSLYKFWRKRGFHSSEHRKPAIRLYRNDSDKS